MQYKITIDNFDGPLDLLLHLIKENNIDIYDIKVEEIAKQYLDYIESMKNLNLSIASEYLVMASELIEMKSRMLLPKREEEDTDEYEEDPREVLIERLLAYKKYKEVTKEFKDLELTRKLVISKEQENLSKYLKEEENENLSASDLVDAFNNLLEKKRLEKPVQTKITKKELSVRKVNFEDLFGNSSKEEIIVSFLSILEMLKKDEIIVKQENNFNNIIVCLKGGV